MSATPTRQRWRPLAIPRHDEGALARREAIFVWLFGLTVLAASALAFRQPGYMDAYYYYHVGSNLAQGRGLVEDLVWNYLPPPATVTHPSNLYWMPLTSLLAAPALALLGPSFRAAQIPFVLAGSLLPVLAYALGRDLFGSRRRALGMAALTLFSGYYFVYWTAIDSFALFALAANLALLAMGRAVRSARWAAAVGLSAALGHLARADGVLLLGAFFVVLLLHRHWGRTDRAPSPIALFAVAVAAYVLAMAPWFGRNWLAIGAPMPPAGLQTLFLREYNEFFGYDLDLSLASYWQWGWLNIVQAKVEALGRSLLVLFGMEYYLVPFAVLGIWRLRSDQRHWPFLVYGLVLYLAMSLLFTFPAARGSMLHSGAALLPWLAGGALCGLDRAVELAARRFSHWNVPLAQRNLAAILIAASVGMSLLVLAQKVATWDERYDQYGVLADWFAVHAPGALVMIADPPGFVYSSHRPAVVIPSNGPAAALAVGRRYGIAYMALEKVHSRPFEALYRGEETAPGLECVATVGDTQIYRLDPAAR